MAGLLRGRGWGLLSFLRTFFPSFPSSSAGQTNRGWLQKLLLPETRVRRALRRSGPTLPGPGFTPRKDPAHNTKARPCPSLLPPPAPVSSPCIFLNPLVAGPAPRARQPMAARRGFVTSRGGPARGARLLHCSAPFPGSGFGGAGGDRGGPGRGGGSGRGGRRFSRPDPARRGLPRLLPSPAGRGASPALALQLPPAEGRGEEPSRPGCHAVQHADPAGAVPQPTAAAAAAPPAAAAGPGPAAGPAAAAPRAPAAVPPVPREGGPADQEERHHGRLQGHHAGAGLGHQRESFGDLQQEDGGEIRPQGRWGQLSWIPLSPAPGWG